MVSGRGVDLLGDDLVNVERHDAPRDLSLAEAALSNPSPEPPPNGPCERCRQNPAQYRCIHCRQGVCRTDFWTMLGLCKTCATEAEIKEAREGRRARPALDIKWIED
jgi:hypothetical protein